jgi:glutamate/tyrosine decarboxylase-like PLP-dependent enzyme
VKSIQETLKTAYQLTVEHLGGKPHVGPLLLPDELRETLGLKLSKDGVNAEAIQIEMRNFLHYSANTLTPQFQNQLFSGLNPYALAGDWLSTIVNTTMATYEASPVGTLVEKELIRHMNDIVGWKKGDGIMVSGGSNSNLVGMLVARNYLYPETKQAGIGSKIFTAFVSEESHYSFDKAINLMGMGTKHLIKVPSDEQGRMLPAELREKIQESIARGETPFFVSATAGTTVLGAFDPIREISSIAKEFNLWLHVDGAWGGSTLLSKKHRYLMDGSDLADSMTWDTHKMLGTGLISSFFLCRHPRALRASNDSGDGNYIFHDSETSDWDSGPSSLQCGRRIDAFKVWLMWKALGDLGLEKLVDDLFTKADLARSLIESRPELQLLFESHMLNICFRYRDAVDPDKLVIKVRQRLLEEGHHFVNYSTRRGKTFFRMIIANPELEESHTQNFLDRVIKLSKELN